MIVVVEFELNHNLKLQINPSGAFGLCIKLIRRERFIALSLSAWYKLRAHIPLLRTEGYNLKLTDNKEVNVVQFEDRRYVGFHNTYKRQDQVYSVYINLNDDEWSRFLAALDAIDIMFPPKKLERCPSCAVVKQVVPLINGRMKESNLEADQLENVRQNNAVAYNQEMHMCEYCGARDYTFYEFMENCHCHQYNCRKCEPENFCDTCGTITVFGV